MQLLIIWASWRACIVLSRDVLRGGGFHAGQLTAVVLAGVHLAQQTEEQKIIAVITTVPSGVVATPPYAQPFMTAPAPSSTTSNSADVTTFFVTSIRLIRSP